MSLLAHLVVPGPLGQRTGGYVYDRRIADGLRVLGWQVRVHELAGAFPIADEPARTAARSCLDAIAAEPGVTVIDGLALPAFASPIGGLPSAWVHTNVSSAGRMPSFRNS